jgi:hypothetical protein
MISTRALDCSRMLESQQDECDDSTFDSMRAIHVEVRQRLESTATKAELDRHVRRYLENIGRLTESSRTEFQVGSFLEV